MDYFAPARFDPKDHINERLWATSVTIQRAIQEPRDVASPDDIGAQQAMLRGDSVLPWVPDIVGSQWRHRDALLVVGTAYAGFISEFSGRHQKNTIALSKYYDLASQPVGIFQTQFLETVVSGDYAFYDPVADLLEGLVDPVKVALFDLCRASFVRRGHGYERRIDSSKETETVCARPEIYSEYVEWVADPVDEELGPRAWTWARLRDSKTKCIVALGRVAEHGILRTLKWNLTNFKVHLKRNRNVSAELSLADSRWAGKYANKSVTISHWYQFECPEEVDWWCVSGSINGEDRMWSVVAVNHPTSRDFRARIAQSRKRVEVAQSAVRATEGPLSW